MPFIEKSGGTTGVLRCAPLWSGARPVAGVVGRFWGMPRRHLLPEQVFGSSTSHFRAIRKHYHHLYHNMLRKAFNNLRSCASAGEPSRRIEMAMPTAVIPRSFPISNLYRGDDENLFRFSVD